MVHDRHADMAIVWQVLITWNLPSKRNIVAYNLHKKKGKSGCSQQFEKVTITIGNVSQVHSWKQRYFYV